MEVSSCNSIYERYFLSSSPRFLFNESYKQTSHAFEDMTFSQRSGVPPGDFSNFKCANYTRFRSINSPRDRQFNNYRCGALPVITSRIICGPRKFRALTREGLFFRFPTASSRRWTMRTGLINASLKRRTMDEINLLPTATTTAPTIRPSHPASPIGGQRFPLIAYRE